MKSITKLCGALALGLSLTACGGIEQTTLDAGPLMYGQLAQFTVQGPNLDKGITLVAPKCSGITEIAGSTPNLRAYNCTPTASGSITVTVVGGNVVLRDGKFDIPVPQVTLKTSMGDMLLELDPTAAPLSVNNFLQYVSSGFYSNLIFHRVVVSPFAIIQGGGFDATLTQPTTKAPIKLESNNGLTNLRGTLAMARSTVADSGTSQFYINVVDNPDFDYVSATQPGYAVFGKVLTGLPVVDAIAAVPTGVRGSMNDVPLTDVVILSATQTR